MTTTSKYLMKAITFPGFVQVTINYGQGDQLLLSVPTGEQAAYPEAIRLNREECDRKVDEFIADYQKHYPNMEVVRRAARTAIAEVEQS